MHRVKPDVKAIFTAALELPVGRDRIDYLAESCGGNDTFRRRIEELLDAFDRASDVLGPARPAVSATGSDRAADAECPTEPFEPPIRDDPEATEARQPDTEVDRTTDHAPGITFADPDATAAHDGPGDGRADGAALPSGAMVRYFGDYEIRRELGRGGMGVVYEARQVSLNRPVALKMVKAGLLADDGELRRFRNEAEAVALLDHPGIVPVYEVGEYAGQSYFSMKLVPGGSLVPLMSRYKTDFRAAAHLVAEAAEAVAHAHARGVLHRDLKPANILVDDQGHPHVTDFGLAKRVEADVEITQSGAILGTPAYMSPEQASGRRGAVTIASDVYGLGAVLYAVLTGRAPFRGDSVVETIDAVRNRPPQPPTSLNGAVPGDLETICLKCLEKDPARRYATARDLAADLGRWLDGRPILARPVSPAERVVKWVRRHKLVAALSGAAVIGAIVGVSGLAWGFSAAVAARDDALRGEDAARRLAYAAALNLAERDWRESNVGQVLRRLDETSPPPGKSDLRGFEWYYLDGLCHGQVRTLAGHSNIVESVAYSRDGRLVATASWDRTVRLWDPATGAAIRTMTATQAVRDVAFSPDGTRLASAGSEGELIVWDPATGAPIQTLKGHAATVNFVAFSPDGRILASTSDDHTVRLWDAATGASVRVIADPGPRNLGEIAFSADGRSLLSAGGGRSTIRVWEAATGRLFRTLESGQPEPTYRVIVSPDGRTIAASTGNGKIVLWDAATGALTRTIGDTSDSGTLRGLTFSPDGRSIASTDGTGAVIIRDGAAGAVRRIIRGHTGLIDDIAFSPDGSRLASASWDLTVKIWDITREQDLRLIPAEARVRDVVFGPDGSYLVSAGTDGVIVLWERSTGRAVRTFRGHTGIVTSLAIRPDGRTLASAGDDHTVRVWEVATGRAIHVLEGHTASVRDVAFSPDGKGLASAGLDRIVILWDADAGRRIHTLAGHIKPAQTLAFSRDGKILVTAGSDGFVIAWDPVEGRQVQAIRADAGPIYAVAVSPDGRRVATGIGPTIELWDLASGGEVRALRGHAETILALMFSGDGRRLASAGDDHTARIWDPESGQELMALPGHTDTVWSVAFSPGGDAIATASGRAVRLRELPDAPRAPH
jgi:WD40 repeat protein